MKTFPAILFALATTAVIAFSLFAVGANALLNKNSTPVLNSPGVSAVSAASSQVDSQAVSAAADQQAQQQMQDQLNQRNQLVSQYQDREKQYQAQLKDAAQKLDDANNQLAQANQQIEQASQMVTSYQNVLSELQRRGLIRITSDGRILVGRSTSNFGSGN